MTARECNVEGIRCQGCGATEADCAWNHNDCCAMCTHTFDGGTTRKFLCFGCNRVITWISQKLPESGLCRLCVARKNSKQQVA